MSATKRATPFESWPAKPTPEVRDAKAATVPAPEPQRPSQLRLKPFLCSPQPRRFARVPTHAVGVYPEHREYPRASLKLPLRLRSVRGVPEEFPITLVTRDISSTGVFFLCPKELTAGASIELEIVLVSRPMGLGNVVMVTLAQVCRVEKADMPAWFGVAASFNDVQFDRDDSIPSRYLKP
jgi:PilZ domain